MKNNIEIEDLAAASRQEIIRTTGLMDYTSARLTRRQYRSRITESRRAMHQALRQARRYDGGLPAEMQSAKAITVEAGKAQRLAARQCWANRTGRPIDLVTLMGQQSKDGAPIWTIVDPAQPVSGFNGYRESTYMHIGSKYVSDFQLPARGFGWQPSGIPKLPAKARRLLSDPKIRRRAEWIGVLYQPDSWRQVNPDPAVVVKWKATGQYAALAVWGSDYHRIMEFVS